MNRPLLSRATLVALLAGLLALAQAAPAAAIGAFGPVQEIHRHCKPAFFGDMTVDGDIAAAPDGAVSGFVSINGTGECEGNEIWYVERRDGRWTKRLSPYLGEVLAVAADSTGTYLLYLSTPTSLRITKRTAGGVFTGGRELSSNPCCRVTGDVVATAGTWWAVWSESATPPGEESYDLYQAKTVGPHQLIKQNITNSPDVDETYPSVALRPGPRASMVWERTERSASGNRLGVGTAGSAGDWSLRPFELTPAVDGVRVREPDFAFAGGVSHIIWVQWEDATGDPKVLTADDRGGWSTVKVFNTLSNGPPRVAMSSGKVFAAWTTEASPPRAFAAERSTAAGATWTGAAVSPSDTTDHQVLGLAGTGGRATVLIWDRTRVYARTQA